MFLDWAGPEEGTSAGPTDALLPSGSDLPPALRAAPGAESSFLD